MKIDWTILNKIWLEDKINQKIKKTWIKDWLFEFFKVKNVVIRIASIILVTLVFAIIFFVLRANGLKGFYGEPLFNTGWAFSGNSNGGWVVYFVKILVSLILLSFWIVFNKWYININIWVVFINSMFNVIDKAMPDYYNDQVYYDAVVDYFHWPTFTNNIADIFIIAFIATTFASILLDVLLDYLKNKNKKEDGE